MTDAALPEGQAGARSQDDWIALIAAARGTGDFLAAFDASQRALKDHPDDLRFVQGAVRALLDARAFGQAEDRLARLEQSGRLDHMEPTKLWGDLIAARGRIYKERAFVAQGAERMALSRQSAEVYERAFSRRREAFPAINAATMWRLAGEEARATALAGTALRLAEAEQEKYWTPATIAEALILLGETQGAKDALARARADAHSNWGDIASTRRQLRQLLPATDLPMSLLDGLAPPGVLCVLPEPFGPELQATDFQGGPEIGERIGEIVKTTEAAVAFSTLLTPLDLAIAEAILAQNIELRLVLPCSVEDCRAGFKRYGAAWDARFADCVARVVTAGGGDRHRVVAVTSDGQPDEETLLLLCRKQMVGLALLRADWLVDAPVYRLTPARDAGGKTSIRSRLFRPGAADRVILSDGARRSDRLDRALLFGDVRSFSKLQEHHLEIFLERVIGGFADVLDGYGSTVEYAETAGDGVYLVIHDVGSAAECCLKLQTVLRPEHIAAVGLPDYLALRLGAHVGPVKHGLDRVIKRRKFIGMEVTRTARIEPVTPVGEIYVTEQFAATLYHDDRRFHCEYVGIQPMAKGYGECRMYSLRAATRAPGGTAVVFRIGVTGHRDIATRYGAEAEAVGRALSSSLAAIRDAASAAAKEGEAAAGRLPELRFISPLAEGADRLAAEAAHALGYRLQAPLPFAQAEYENDFDTASVAEFRRLLERARSEGGIVELPGTRAAAAASYAAVGQYVVAHADLLVAVWDRSRPTIAGGTGEVVEQALAAGLPVLWISPTHPDTACILLAAPTASGDLPPPRPLAELASILRQLVVRGPD